MAATMPPRPQTLDDAIAALHEAADELGRAKMDEQYLEDARAEVKVEAIKRLMQQTNPLTNRPHSASSAADVVELDDEYVEHRTKQRDAALYTYRCLAAFDAARAHLRILSQTERSHA
jgi:hypothetical protein